MDATLTLTSTSVRPKPGIFTSRTSAPGAASGLTTASIVAPLVAPAMIAAYLFLFDAFYSMRKRHNTKRMILAPQRLRQPTERFVSRLCHPRRPPELSTNCKNVTLQVCLPGAARIEASSTEGERLDDSPISRVPDCSNVDSHWRAARRLQCSGPLQGRPHARLSRAQHP